MKNRSHRYDINRPSPRHGHKYTKYKMCLIIMMVIGIKQRLNNTWSSIHEKVKGTVMQIEKALINDRLHSSKVSRNFSIPTIYNFAIIYPWNLLFS